MICESRGFRHARFASWRPPQETYMQSAGDSHAVPRRPQHLSCGGRFCGVHVRVGAKAEAKASASVRGLLPRVADR